MTHEELILKYLDGTISAAELRDFESLRGDADFDKIFVETQQILSASKGQLESMNWDKASAWDNIERSIDTNQEKVKIPLLSRRSYMSIAATLALLIASIFVFKYSDYSKNKGLSLLAQENIVYELSDGSLVYLEKGSSLEIDKNYNETSRKLNVSGTAFFVVKPNKDKVFEVANSHLIALVKGTSFEMTDVLDRASVTVQTGVVEVRSDDVSNELRAGERLNLHGEKIELLRVHVNSDWTSNVLSFKDVNLSTILQQVEGFYQTTVKIDDALLDKKYTISLENLDIEEVIQVLSKLTRTEIQHSAEGYILN